MSQFNNCTKTANMSDAPAKPAGRPMKFPYTFSAKIAQFPLKFYVNNQWMWKFYIFGIVCTIPVFYKIHKLANSPANVAKWAESKRKEAEAHHH
ncbi:hypothetical protein Bhyg_10174 [Pseudolycoriella hygida]|uniref:Uncharacterized protein n=1 Tax=Pseudolycoriella hygida TaxID=35572 RepID=A0A9Q0MUK2_9DIPT|nr:hypothetical protein Bhyg_10174 [Pseudolycoriella hygida]